MPPPMMAMSTPCMAAILPMVQTGPDGRVAKRVYAQVQPFFRLVPYR